MRDKQVVYDLSMEFFPEQLLAILQQQHLPANWVAGIFDSTGVLIARTREHVRFVGHKGSPALVQRMSEVAEGSLPTKTLEGIP